MLATVSFLALALAACIAEVHIGPDNKCYQDGKLMPDGVTYYPDPCTICGCNDNGIFCFAPKNCSPLRCVDAVHHPDKCCPECPNGK